MDYSNFKPRLTALLKSVGLDVAFDRGEGDRLFFDGEEVLDLVGGYGSLILGHSHPALLDVAQRILSERVPMHAQASRRLAAEGLAAELSRRAGADFVALFCNSGTEAVEAALKHAMLETGGRNFISLEGGFHGKTLGALRLSSGPRARPNDADHLESLFRTTPDLAGFIFEPIQGEGGIVPLDPSFVRRASELCAERRVPLIADECQTGMGRTGRFLASEQADYVLLSKSLGGGLAKISALLVRRDRYRDVFDLEHTSTYADDEFSCRIALKTLELMDDERIERCRLMGDRFIRGLEALRSKYPDVLSEVRGRGLMVGVEFAPTDRSPSFAMRYLWAQERLVLLVVARLFHVHRIRILPTLSRPSTLRIEPSSLIRDEDIDRTIRALDEVCAVVRNRDAAELTSYVTDRMPPREEGMPIFFDPERILPRAAATKVGWLFHLVHSHSLASLDASFRDIAPLRIEKLLAAMADDCRPVVMSGVDIRSRTGDRVRFYPILLPVTSRWMKSRDPSAAVQPQIELHRFNSGRIGYVELGSEER